MTVNPDDDPWAIFRARWFAWPVIFILSLLAMIREEPMYIVCVAAVVTVLIATPFALGLLVGLLW